MEKKLLKIQRKHAERKVFFQTRVAENRITFCCFSNKSGVKGRGAEALLDVLDAADEAGMEVYLWTDYDIPRLKTYYESFGFVMFEPLRFLRQPSKPIVLKPGIPGVSRPTKADKNPVRHVPKDSQEWRIIEQRVLGELRQ